MSAHPVRRGVDLVPAAPPTQSTPPAPAPPQPLQSPMSRQGRQIVPTTIHPPRRAPRPAPGRVVERSTVFAFVAGVTFVLLVLFVVLELGGTLCR
jgi:hypothetical protein